MSTVRWLLPFALLILLPTRVLGEGVIAFGQGINGAWAEAHGSDYATRDEAVTAVVTSCNSRALGFACWVTTEFNSACAAIAVTVGNNGQGTATRPTENAARREALRQCRIGNPGSSCTIQAAICDTVSEADNRRKEIERKMFLGQWDACFGRGGLTAEITSCRIAVNYSELLPEDARKLDAQIARLERVAQEQETQRMVTERQEQEAIRAEEERRQAELRRAEELAEQRGREARAEERRLEATRTYIAALDACRDFSPADCDAALASGELKEADKPNLKRWQAVATKYAREVKACQEGASSACDYALSSPALKDAERIEQWRAEASLVYRALMFTEHAASTSLAFAKETASAAKTKAESAWEYVRDLPTSTHIASGVAALSLVVAGLSIRRTMPTRPRTAKRRTS